MELMSRRNFNASQFTLTAATTSANGADQDNFVGRGLHVTVDLTAFSGTSITVTIEGKDPLSGKYYTLLASAALAAVATTVLKVYPGLTAAANTVASDILPRVWRVKTTIASATVTGTINASVIQ